MFPIIQCQCFDKRRGVYLLEKVVFIKIRVLFWPEISAVCHCFAIELSQRLETHSQLIHDAGDNGNAWQLFKQFEKVAKRWQPLAMMATHWQCTVNVLAIIGDGGQCGGNPPQPSVATTLPASCQQVASIISASVNGA